MNSDFNQFVTSKINENMGSYIDEDGNNIIISENTILNSRIFGDMLPSTLPLPNTLLIDTDGNICVRWRPNKYRKFSITINDSDKLSYGWCDGSDCGNGIINFINGLPKLLLSLMKLIILKSP